MTRSVVPFLALLAAGLAAAPARSNRAVHFDGTEHAVVRQINGMRAAQGLGPVRMSRALSRAAEHHSRDMLRHDFFDHTSSDGTPFDRRIRRYADASMLGETLAAIGQRHGGAGTIVQMWMDSPPHRAILLTRGFRRIGLARRWGTLGGAGQAVVTADFASRR